LNRQKQSTNKTKKVKKWFVAGDLFLFLFLNNALRCRLLDALIPRLTHLASAGATISIILGTYFWYLVTRQPQTARLATTMMISAGGSHLLVHFLKRQVNRPRPHQQLLPQIRIFNVPICAYSFPSGHTAAAFAIGLPLSWAAAAGLWSNIALCWAAIIGFSRIYLGVHYPSDVMAGAGLGVGGALLARMIMPI